MEQHFLEPGLGRFGNPVGDFIAQECEKVSGRHDGGFGDVVVAKLRREGRSEGKVVGGFRDLSIQCRWGSGVPPYLYCTEVRSPIPAVHVGPQT